MAGACCSYHDLAIIMRHRKLVRVEFLCGACNKCIVFTESVSSSVEEKGLSSEARAEEPISDVIWVFAITTGYYFFCVTVSNIFYNFIYSIALCSGLQFGVR